MNVRLKPATADDADLIADIKMDRTLWTYEPKEDIPTDREATKREVLKRIESDWYKEHLIVLDDPAQTAVGELHLHWYIRERGSWEIGYCVFPHYRGNGYCHTAAMLGLKDAFTRYGAHKVVGMCNAHNIVSARIMEKCGMRKEGVFKEELPWNGIWADQLFYSILESEYKG
jgi:RimJ/RimL family protein N-acetyltransferase